MFRLLTETEVLFRPIPKPKVVLQFRQNRNSAKMAEIRPKTETESVSVVHYLFSTYILVSVFGKTVNKKNMIILSVVANMKKAY